MTPIEQSRRAGTEERRDALIKQARSEYRRTVRELKLISRKINAPIPKKPQLEPSGDLSPMTIRQAAEFVLGAASEPMRLTELSIEIMRLGSVLYTQVVRCFLLAKGLHSP